MSFRKGPSRIATTRCHDSCCVHQQPLQRDSNDCAARASGGFLDAERHSEHYAAIAQGFYPNVSSKKVLHGKVYMK